MDLPQEVDVVVLGTGMPESIVAAAFSRIGQTVLHLDKNGYYSADWASFNLQGIERWVEQHQVNPTEDDVLPRPDVDEKSVLEDGERLVALPLDKSSFSNAELKYHARDEDEKSKEKPDAKEKSEADIETKVDTGTDNAETVDKVGSDTKDEEGQNQKSDIDIETQLINQGGVNNEEPNQSSGENRDCKELTAKTGVDKEAEASNMQYTHYEQQETTPTGASGDSEAVCTANTDTKTENEQVRWTVKKIKSEWRRFNLDLSPKVLYSVGEMVSLLIESDISKYCEFKTVTQILTLLDGQIEKVPCSRADVFSSKRVSMLEKRMLMKFIQFCLDYENKQEEIQDILEKPFTDFLKSRKLTATVQHYIQHSIAMATDSMTTKQGLEQMKKFLSSLGRYGNTAFLWSLYGSGELPQSFCRMCAVFGGTYCLRMSAASIILNSENKCTGIVTTEGQKIKCKWLIMETTYTPDEFLIPGQTKTISRAILMTDKPLLTMDQQEQLSLMCLPCPDDGDRPVYILQLPPSSMSSPPGIYITHLTRRGTEGSKPGEDFTYAMDHLFCTDGSGESDKPSVLWEMYFTQEDHSSVHPADSLPDNVILTSGPGVELDIDKPVTEARDIFKKILPEEEFLPKAPNPEDIIYVDDTEAQVADGSSKSEFDEQNVDQSEGANQTDQSQGSLNNQSETVTEKDQSKTNSSSQSEDVLQNNQSETSSEEKKAQAEGDVGNQNNES